MQTKDVVVYQSTEGREMESIEIDHIVSHRQSTHSSQCDQLPEIYFVVNLSRAENNMPRCLPEL